MASCVIASRSGALVRRGDEPRELSYVVGRGSLYYLYLAYVARDRLGYKDDRTAVLGNAKAEIRYILYRNGELVVFLKK